MTLSKDASDATAAVHAGVYVDEQYHSVTTPIYTTSTFYFNGSGDPPPYDYTRCGNPTRQALQENINALEGGDQAFAVCSGVTAIHTVLLLLKSGDHVICGREIYGGSHRLFERVFSGLGIQFSFVDMFNVEDVAAAVRPETRMIWIETPTNPLLNIVDIQAVVALAQERGILTALDNTFMTPILQRPIEFGVDLVVYSTTKYLNGHSDVMGGAIVTRTADLSRRLDFLIGAIGVGSAPFDAWLVLRGIKTLPHRMKVHEQNAMAIVEFLKEHPMVKRVLYPGLSEHPCHELAKRQQKGFGGMLSCELDLEKLDLQRFFKALKYFKLSVSLGGVESLIQHPWSMSHAAMPKEARLAAGISKAIVRVSAGIEEVKDLIDDLKQALDTASIL